MSDDLWIVALRNFEDVVIRSPIPVMLVFWSHQCSGCDRLIETVKTLSGRYLGRVRFGLVDVDDQSELARQLGIGGYPCVLILDQGRLYANVGGELPLSAYKKVLDSLLADKAAHDRPAHKKLFHFKT